MCMDRFYEKAAKCDENVSDTVIHLTSIKFEYMAWGSILAIKDVGLETGFIRGGLIRKKFSECISY